MSNLAFYRLVGVVVAVSSLLAIFSDKRFAWVAVFFGLHLLQHTYTGFCVLQKMLAKNEPTM